MITEETVIMKRSIFFGKEDETGKEVLEIQRKFVNLKFEIYPGDASYQGFDV